MREEQTKTAISLTKYFISLPDSDELLFYAFVVCMFFSLLLFIVQVIYLHNINAYTHLLPSLEKTPLRFLYELSLIFIQCVVQMLFSLFIPFILFWLVLRFLFTQIPNKQLLALSLICVTFYGSGIVLSFAFHTLTYVPIFSDAVLFLCGAIASLVVYLTVAFVFGSRWKSLVALVVEVLLFAVFISLNGPAYVQMHSSVAIFHLLISSVLMVLFFIFLAFMLNAPMRKNVGVDAWQTLSVFIQDWLYGSTDISKLMDDIAENTMVKVSQILFKVGHKRVALLAPMFHYGPFGDVGSSNFPAEYNHEIGRDVEGIAVHGTATHDFDVVEDIAPRMAKWTSSLLTNKFERCEVGISEASYGDAHAKALFFNDTCLLMLSRAPKNTEDISAGVGLWIAEALKNKLGLKQVVVCDAHNSDQGIVESYEVGSTQAYEYYMAAMGLEKPKSMAPLRLAVEHIDKSELGDDLYIGDNGVYVLAFSTQPKPFLMVVFDGNSIYPSCYRRLVNRLKRFGAEVEVLTTDSHKVNKLSGVLNPVECTPRLLERIDQAAEHALESMKHATVLGAEDFFKIKTLGPDLSVEFVSTVNSIMSIGRILGPIVLILALAIISYLLSKV